MARVGLVGGLGPESTIDYYRRILAAWERTAPGSAPSIVIDSLDVQVGRAARDAVHDGGVFLSRGLCETRDRRGRGEFREKTRAGFLALLGRLVDRDSTGLHVATIVDRLRGGQEL